MPLARNSLFQGDFLAVAAAATVTIVPRTVLGGPGNGASSDRVNIGSMGVGRQGLADMPQFLANPNAQVVAVCDVRRECDCSLFYDDDSNNPLHREYREGWSL